MCSNKTKCKLNFTDISQYSKKTTLRTHIEANMHELTSASKPSMSVFRLDIFWLAY